MSVFRRKTSKGVMDRFYYQFMIDGKQYYGPCFDAEGKPCTKKKDAEAAETRRRQLESKLSQQRTVKAVVENFLTEMTGGNKVALDDAWAAVLRKPKRRDPGVRQLTMLQRRWQDFVAFMHATYPDVACMSEVRRVHAEAYVAVVRAGGRFDKTVKGRHGKYMTQLSPKTKNDMLAACKYVFRLLGEDAGIIENPFGLIEKQEERHEEREAFTPEELKKIGEAARGSWLYPLFLTAVSTGLREGDICNLEWTSVDFENRELRIKMKKTGKTVFPPMLPPLEHYLRTLPREGRHVFPELHRLYATRSMEIGRRVGEFLTGLGIVARVKVDGRDRIVVRKDVHSARHTFAYLAALHGVPLPIVQSILGHMSADMTRRYMDHATREARRQELSKLPDYLGLLPAGGEPQQSVEALIEEVNKYAKTSTPAKLVQALAILKG